MKLFKRSRKGNWVDIFEYSRGALIIGISILIVYILLTSFNDIIVSSSTTNPILNDTDGLSAMQGAVDIFPKATDYIIPIIFIFFLGFSAWSARKIESSHKFAFIGVFVMVIAVLFAMFIETMWDSFTTQAIIAAKMSYYPITNFFLSFLRYFVIIYAIIVGVSLYAKPE